MNKSPVPETQIQPFWKALLKSAGFVLLFEAAQYLLGTVVQFACLFRAENLASISEEGLYDYLKSTYFPVLFEVMFLAAGLFLLVTALIYLARPRTFTEATGLKGASPLGCVASVFLGMGAFYLASLLMQALDLVPLVHNSAEEYGQQYEEIETAIEQNGRPWVDVLYTVIGAPVAEEILCRGLVLRQLRRSVSEWTAIFLSALAFALIHGNVFQMAFTFPLGVLLGYVAVKFNSVLPSILLHAAFNGSNYLPELGEYLGFAEEDPRYEIFVAVFLVSIPLGGLLLYLAARKRPLVTARSPKRLLPPLVLPPIPVRHDLRGPAYDRPVGAYPTYSESEGDPMAAPEYLVVGLGNPGEKYASTRHNAGFIAMDYLAIREGLDVSRLRFKALTADKTVDGKHVLFLKPQTFMNLSGESVREAAAFYHIPPEKILVLVDDVNFEPGVLRIRKEGSAGGHNGLKSIIECLGTDAFPRVRLGVGAVPPERDLVGWVLGSLPSGDMDKLVSTLEDVRQTVHFFLAGDLDGAMNAFNGKTR